MITFECKMQRADFTLDAAFESGNGILALFGPSGSGKTTILRLIAGLDLPDRGRITLNGETLLDTERRFSVPVHKRRAGLVFQDGQLLPHLTVAQNLRFGSYFARNAEPLVSFGDTLALLGIEHLQSRYPATLSGGERQRVAIGRALLSSPRVLLMDEPLASLDMARKLEILPFIERLRSELALPIIYVSHAVEEVARLATTVVRLEQGAVQAFGAPADVLAPSADQVSDRFEAVSMLVGRVARHLPEHEITVLDHPAGEIVLQALLDQHPGQPVRLAIGATNVVLALARPTGMSIRTALAGRVADIENTAGPLALVTIELAGGDRIACFVTRFAIADLALKRDTPLFALVKSVSIDERGVAPKG